MGNTGYATKQTTVAGLQNPCIKHHMTKYMTILFSVASYCHKLKGEKGTGEVARLKSLREPVVTRSPFFDKLLRRPSETLAGEPSSGQRMCCNLKPCS